MIHYMHWNHTSSELCPTSSYALPQNSTQVSMISIRLSDANRRRYQPHTLETTSGLETMITIFVLSSFQVSVVSSHLPLAVFDTSNLSFPLPHLAVATLHSSAIGHALSTNNPCTWPPYVPYVQSNRQSAHAPPAAAWFIREMYLPSVVLAVRSSF